MYTYIYCRQMKHANTSYSPYFFLSVFFVSNPRSSATHIFLPLDAAAAIPAVYLSPCMPNNSSTLPPHAYIYIYIYIYYIYVCMYVYVYVALPISLRVVSSAPLTAVAMCSAFCWREMQGSLRKRSKVLLVACSHLKYIADYVVILYIS
jgi:hypothetical protein